MMLRRRPPSRPTAILLAAATALGGCGTASTPGRPTPDRPPTATATARPLPPASSAQPSGGPTSTTPSLGADPRPDAGRTATPAAATCADLAASLSLRQQVGQLFMVGVDTRIGVSERQVAAMAAAKPGSAILLGNTSAGADAVRRLAAAARTAGGTPPRVEVLVAVDQEGGQVQRLQGDGFERMPSALQQSRRSGSRLRADATRWGRQLKRAGIDANLAPVADVVPARLQDVNQPIGVLRRGYGPDRARVAASVAAFTRGMTDAGVATSAKHFPGLGKVRGNTDFTSRVVDSTTARSDPDLAGFRAAVRAGVDMVMLSSAYYAKIDPDQPAAFSTSVVSGMLRGDLGFDGVVISDDLAAVAMESWTPRQRALRFLRAGGDLAIVGDPSLLAPMVSAVRAAAEAEPEFAEQVVQHAARVLRMKARHGLAACR